MYPILLNDSFFSSLWEVAQAYNSHLEYMVGDRRIFIGKKKEVSNIITNIQSSILEVFKAHKSKSKNLESPFTSWDDAILKEWKGISLPFKGSLLKNSRGKEKRTDVKWKPPNYPSWKMNFDGVLKGNSEISRVGLFICNSRGEILVVETERILNTTNIVAEATTFVYGLRVACEIGSKI